MQRENRLAGNGSNNTSHRLGSKSGNNSSNNQSLASRSRTLSDITNVTEYNPKTNVTGKEFKHPQQQPLKPLGPLDELCNKFSDLQIEKPSSAQDVQEYASDVLNTLFRQEMAGWPDYMDSQTDISAKMRTILIDWLIEVHMKYRLCQETLHLAVNLIDRYLASTSVMRKRLQLVGVTAMFIASKFEDVKPPELHEMVYITDNAYKKEDVLLMECTMLTTLGFKVAVSTGAHFFEALQKANACDSMHRDLAQYLLDLSLLDMRMLQYTPSRIVAAALLLSNELLKRKSMWPATMELQSRHTQESLTSCADDLRLLYETDQAGGQLQADHKNGVCSAVHKKYSVAQRHEVAKIVFPA